MPGVDARGRARLYWDDQAIGWQTARYDDLIADKYLYNRCHLIAYSMAGENANEQNLITGTRYLNIDGMSDFEMLIVSYVNISENHVLYRVTPIFEGDNLLASGVLMEAYSVEDDGKGICFCAYAYNVQPGITIDYASGESRRTDAPDGTGSEPSTDESGETPDAFTESSWAADPAKDALQYIGNTKSKAFHLPTCPNLPSNHNRIILSSREEAISEGYHPCGNCNP